MCLTKETKTVDIFEEKLENQNKIILNYEKKIQDLEDQICKLENENLLLNEFKLLKKTVDTTKNIEQDWEYKDNVCYYLYF